MQYTWTRPNAFLGPLIDEHLDRRGDLRDLDMGPWLWVYSDYLMRFRDHELTALTSEANAIFAEVEKRGATNVRPLSAEEITDRRQASKQLPTYFGQPFRFSEAALAVSKRTGATPPACVVDPRIVSMRLREKDIAVHVQAGAPDAEFTIYDFVQVQRSLLQCEPFDIVQLMVHDPAVLRSAIISNLLAQVSAHGVLS